VYPVCGSRAIRCCLHAQSGTRFVSSHCVFCDLIKGAGEVSICYEDADAVAFMDIQPVNRGHALVVPREHYASLEDIPGPLGKHLFDVAWRLGEVIRDVTRCDGMNLLVSSGSAAGQDVFHYHVHVIPRMHGDGWDVPLPFEGGTPVSRQHLDATAVQILTALHDPMRVKDSATRYARRATDAV
jgi:histidine triad (HIT) family protein